MQLQFRKMYWNQRYRFTLEEAVLLSRMSSSIKLNKEKWKKNSFYHFGQKIYEAEGPLLEEHGTRDGIQKVEYCTGLRFYDDSHVYNIVDSQGNSNGATALKEGCDIHCVSCNTNLNEEDYSKDYPVLMVFDKDIKRAEILCRDCYEEIYKNRYVLPDVHKEKHLIALIKHLNTK